MNCGLMEVAASYLYGDGVDRWYIPGEVGEAIPHHLRPNIYPNPTDGLPPEVSTQQQEAA